MQLTEAIEKHIIIRCTENDDRAERNNLCTALKTHFYKCCLNNGCLTVESLSADFLTGFREELHFKQSYKGFFLCPSSKNHILRRVKAFLRWLFKENYINHDMSLALEYYKVPRTLPRNILDEKQIYDFLEACATETLRGYRDRVMLELFYGTGIRRQELINLKVSDVDLNQKTLFISQGKGKKDRLVPLGQGLTQMLRHYIREIRPKLMKGQHDYLIVSSWYSGGLKAGRIGTVVELYAKKAGIKQRVYPHLLRHACATHMIRRGAPIRAVQELLGHESILTTQKYTHLTITDLKKAHAKYHPREIPPRDPRPPII